MTIIIPAYKPDEKLLGLIRALNESVAARILIVNDGSGEAFDPVFQRASSLGCTLLTHKVNRGKGAALKTAFCYLKEEEIKDDIFCTADADGQHLPEDIIRCLNEAKAHPEALILGSRSFEENVPLRSRFGNSASRITFHVLMGKKIRDTQTGLRAFHYALLDEMMAVDGDRYEYEMQVLCRFAKKKIPLREIGIKTVYIEENRSSHFNPFRDAMRVYGILFKCAFGSLFQILSFAVSSLLAVVIDLVMLYLLYEWVLAPFLPGENLEVIRYGIALATARTTSSVVNYLINRKVVFGNLKDPVKTFTLYVLLVVLIFFANYGLGALFLKLGFHVLIAEITAQVLCFPVSFLVQKYWIFPKKKGDQ